MEKKVCNNVLDKIKKEKIYPKPKWHFMTKNILFWGVFGVSVGLGSVAVSIFIHRLTIADWEIYEYLGRGPLTHGLMVFPYRWVIAIAILSILAIYNFHHTKKGYCYKSYYVVGGSIGLSIVVGTILFFVGGAKLADERIEHMSPFAPGRFENQVETWNHPERGLLAGEVDGVYETDEYFVLIDFSDNVWTVLCANPCKIGLRAVSTGMLVKIEGEQEGEFVFEAEKIRPWGKFHPKEKPAGGFWK